MLLGGGTTASAPHSPRWIPTPPNPHLQVVELRDENARLRERLRQYEPATAPGSRKPSGTGEAAGGPLQQQASAPPGTQPPSGVPSQLSM